MGHAYKFTNPAGMYFTTFATIGWIDVFTRKIYKDIIVESLRHCQEQKGLELFAWIIMSNHVHFIIKGAEGFLLQDTIRDFKKFTSKQIIKAIQENPKESRKVWMLSIFKRAGEYNYRNTHYQLWQNGYHAIELYSPKVTQQKLNYIHNNPVKTGNVEKPADYLYSSARNYADLPGLLDVILLDFALY